MSNRRYLEYDYTQREWTFNEIRDYYYRYFKNIAINNFEWEGTVIKDNGVGLTSEILEEILFETGKAIFFKDEDRGLLALKAIGDSNLNIYYKPTQYTALGNGYSKQVDISNAVIIKNNALMQPTAEGLWYYCGQLADIELAKQINRDACKTPFMMNCTKETELSAKNMFKKIHANEPIILRNKKPTDEGSINAEVLTNDVEFLGAEYDDQFNCVVAKILTLLGIDNYVEDKKERVQSAEVESNEEYIDKSFASSFEQRQKACEKINAMFGTDLTVSYKARVKPKENKEENEEEEVDE